MQTGPESTAINNYRARPGLLQRKMAALMLKAPHSHLISGKKAALSGLCFFALAFNQQVSASEWPEPFPRAKQETHKQLSLTDYRMAAGRIQNKNSGSEPEAWLDLSAGTLNKKLYRIYSEKNTDKVLEHYRKQLTSAGSRVIFECQSRECGSSTDWANRVFRVSTLYGTDRSQAYLLGAQQDGEHTNVSAVYVVKRATGRVYAYSETYRLPSQQFSLAGQNESLLDILSRQGWVTLPVTSDGQFEEGAFEQLSQLAKNLPAEQEFWLVAHRYGSESDETLTAKAKESAQRLLEGFQKMGGTTKNITIKAIGPVAPTETSVRYGGRIELVRKR